MLALCSWRGPAPGELVGWCVGVWWRASMNVCLPGADAPGGLARWRCGVGWWWFGVVVVCDLWFGGWRAGVMVLLKGLTPMLPPPGSGSATWGFGLGVWI